MKRPLETGLHFRIAAFTDWQLIAQLHVESWQSAYQGLLPDEYLQDRLEADRAAHWQVRLGQLLAAGGCAAIVERNHQISGFVCVESPDQDGSVLVDNLHVKPQLKGRGVGTALLEFAACWAKERDAIGMHLFVLEQNTSARAFYAALGWRETDRQAAVMAGMDIVHLRVEHLLPAD